MELDIVVGVFSFEKRLETKKNYLIRIFHHLMRNLWSYFTYYIRFTLTFVLVSMDDCSCIEFLRGFSTQRNVGFQRILNDYLIFRLGLNQEMLSL